MAQIAKKTEPELPIYEAAPLPSNEEARNARVHRSGVMDVHQEDRYGLYVELAKLITDCPVAYTGVNGGVKSGHWGGAKVGQLSACALERAALI